MASNASPGRSAEVDSLIGTLVELAQIPSAVPLGADTLIEPDDPLLVHYVQEQLRPRFVELGGSDIVELPLNQFAVSFGTGKGPCLALVAYTPTQHHNLMTDPWSGSVMVPTELGLDEPCVFGQGVTQNKVHQASLLTLARWLVEERVVLDGTLLLCINNEGRSSHACSTAMFDALTPEPDLVIELFPTGFDISVANRGRIDLYVHVRGEATHSSSPPSSGRVIATVADVLRRIAELDEQVCLNSHPELGAEQVVPYQVAFHPLAPHTLPAGAKITVDRRLLPGTDPLDAADELQASLRDVDPKGCDIVVEPGVVMLPYVFPEDARHLLRPLETAIREHLQAPPHHTVYGGTFDAAGPGSRGIPTVMFGVPDRGSILGDDLVQVSDARREYDILRTTVNAFFGRS